MLELGRGFALVPEPGLELGVAGIAGLQNLDGDRRAVRLAPGEDEGVPPLAEQPLQGVRPQRLAYQIGCDVGQGRCLYNWGEAR